MGIYDERYMRAGARDVRAWDGYASEDGQLGPMFPSLGWRHHPLGKALYAEPFSVVLDFGCGTGRWRPFFGSATKYVGLDQSLEAVQSAINRWAGDPKAIFVHCPGVADGRPIPFRAEVFDVVFTIGVLQHNSDADAAVVAAEVRRVLRKGGRYIGYEAVIGSPWPEGVGFPPHARTNETWAAVLAPGFEPIRQEDALQLFRAV